MHPFCLFFFKKKDEGVVKNKKWTRPGKGWSSTLRDDYYKKRTSNKLIGALTNNN